MPPLAQLSRLVRRHTHGSHYRAVGVPVLNLFLFVSFSHCRGECDCEHSGWSSSKSFPGQQTPGISSHTRHPVCESCSLSLLLWLQSVPYSLPRFHNANVLYWHHVSLHYARSNLDHFDAIFVVVSACQCSRSTGGPRTAEGRDGCHPG